MGGPGEKRARETRQPIKGNNRYPEFNTAVKLWEFVFQNEKKEMAENK